MRFNVASTDRFIFCSNMNENHWTMLQVITSPVRELQLFEPMGLPLRKNKATAAPNCVSTRNLPRHLIQWLQAVCPPRNGDPPWSELAISAIQRRQQLTGFDCGVACLLYAEKCGQMLDRKYIARWTNQKHITLYRQLLQRLMGPALSA